MKPNNGKIWTTMCNDQIEIRSLTEDKLEECLEILEHYFFVHEPVSNATKVSLPENVQARKELTELGRLAAKDGVSLMAVEKATGKAVAVIFNTIISKLSNGEEEFYHKNVKTPQAQALLDFVVYVESQFDVFKEFQIDSIFENVFMATLPQWHGHGIGLAVLKYSILLAQELKEGHIVEGVDEKLLTKRPQLVTAIFSSKYTQKISHAVGFKPVFKSSYKEFSYEGETYDRRIDPVHEVVEVSIRLI